MEAMINGWIQSPHVPMGAVQDCLNAAAAAVEKHGDLTTDPVRACAILIRECGEAMNEALLETVPGQVEVEDRTIQLYAELAQVAATAMLIMTGIRRGL